MIVLSMDSVFLHALAPQHHSRLSQSDKLLHTYGTDGVLEYCNVHWSLTFAIFIVSGLGTCSVMFILIKLGSRGNELSRKGNIIF